MKITEIIRWIRQYEMKWNKKPSVVPISETEALEIMSDYSPVEYASGCERNQIWGIDAEMTPWAEMTRQKMLEIDVERFSSEHRISERAFILHQHKDEFAHHLVQKVTAHILTDVTHLDISFDWDRFAWLKRRVKWIGRKWPVKRKAVRIEGKVLYPYLKIQAPADTHRVRFLVRP